MSAYSHHATVRQPATLRIYARNSLEVPNKFLHVRGVPRESFVVQEGDLTSRTVAWCLHAGMPPPTFAATCPGTIQWGVYHHVTTPGSPCGKIATERWQIRQKRHMHAFRERERERDAHRQTFTYFFCVHMYIHEYLAHRLWSVAHVHTQTLLYTRQTHTHTQTCIHIKMDVSHIYLYMYIHIYVCTSLRFIRPFWRICMSIYVCIRIHTYTGWRRLIGSHKLQIIFHKRATIYGSLLQKMTYKDKRSYVDDIVSLMYTHRHTYIHPRHTHTHIDTRTYTLDIHIHTRV